MNLLTSIIQREIEDKVVYKEVIDHGDTIPNRHVDCLSPQRKKKKEISTRSNKRRTEISKRRTCKEDSNMWAAKNKNKTESGEKSPKKILDVSNIGIIYSSPKYIGENAEQMEKRGRELEKLDRMYSKYFALSSTLNGLVKNEINKMVSRAETAKKTFVEDQ